MRFSLKGISQRHNKEYAYTKLICIQELQEMRLLQKHKLMTSPSKVMKIILHCYSCENITTTCIKNQQKIKCVNTELLEGKQFVDTNKTPNSYNATL